MTTPSKASQRMIPVDADFTDSIIRVDLGTPRIVIAPELQADLDEQIDQLGTRLGNRIRAEMGLSAPQDAQQPPQDRSGDALGTPGGVTGSQAVSKRFPRSDLGDALRAAANYQDRPGAYDDLRTLADRADALEREVSVARDAYNQANRDWVTALRKANDLQWTVDSLNDEATRQSETIGRVRDLLDEIEFATRFIGLHRTTLVREIRNAMDGVE